MLWKVKTLIARKRLPFFQERLKRYKPFFLVIVISFFLADLLILKSQSFFLPSKERPMQKISALKTKKSVQYRAIWDDNIFHPGPIPEKLFEENRLEEPVKTSLPFVLKGTIVHVNSYRSIATVKGRKGESRSYQLGDSIEDQAEIRRIERGKIIFFNRQNGLLEFLEMPKTKQSFLASAPLLKRRVPKKDSLVRRVNGSFQVRRSDLNQYLKKLPEVLRQARMVPNSKVGEDGRMYIDGFRFASIKKGSVYEDLGFKEGDVITEVEGEKVDSPDKALELYHKFETSSQVRMLVNGERRVYTVEENAPIE